MGPRPRLWIFECITDQNAKSIWVPVPTCGFVHAKSDFRTRHTSLCGSQPSPVVLYTQNNVISTRINSLYGSQPSSVVLCIQNSDFITNISNLQGSQPSSVVWCIQNSDIITRITSLYGIQPSSVVLCIHNSAFSTRITSLYGSQTSHVDLWMNNRPEWQVYMGSSTHLWFCACKIATLGPDLKVSMGPSPHLRSLHAKQRL